MTVGEAGAEADPQGTQAPREDTENQCLRGPRSLRSQPRMLKNPRGSNYVVVLFDM